jgi:hypothetical protein
LGHVIWVWLWAVDKTQDGRIPCTRDTSPWLENSVRLVLIRTVEEIEKGTGSGEWKSGGQDIFLVYICSHVKKWDRDFQFPNSFGEWHSQLY